MAQIINIGKWLARSYTANRRGASDKAMNSSDDEAGRLDSWKAIARYLGCDERTARRWESQEGLPVHRHLHNRKATVFALESEIDAWKASRIEEAPRQSTSVPIAALAGIGAFTVTAALVGFYSLRTATDETSRGQVPVHAVSLSVEVIAVGRDFSSPPRISGGEITWGEFDGADSEIMLYSSGEVRQLTDNQTIDMYPDISDGRVVWQQGDGCHEIPSGLPYHCEIVLFDGIETRQLTRNNFAEGRPRIYGETIVWSQYDGTDWEIIVYDGSTARQLTDNQLDDIEPAIHGANIIWAGSDGKDEEIFLFDGIVTFQLTDNDVPDRTPTISSSAAAWTEAGRLIYWQATNAREIGREGIAWRPSASGDLVVWARDHDIFAFDGQAQIRLTASHNPWLGGNRNSTPDIDGQDIVWRGGSGGKDAILRARYLGTQSIVAQR